jgi:hypothetical protein
MLKGKGEQDIYFMLSTELQNFLGKVSENQLFLCSLLCHEGAL